MRWWQGLKWWEVDESDFGARRVKGKIKRTA